MFGNSLQKIYLFLVNAIMFIRMERWTSNFISVTYRVKAKFDEKQVVQLVKEQSS
jgi:hypothetical protein